MVKGLANANAAAIVGARAGTPFASIDDLWRRAGVPVTALVQIAEADGFRPALGMARREALWAIKALRDEPLPLFAAATTREQQLVPEISEPRSEEPTSELQSLMRIPYAVFSLTQKTNHIHNFTHN